MKNETLQFPIKEWLYELRLDTIEIHSPLTTFIDFKEYDFENDLF